MGMERAMGARADGEGGGDVLASGLWRGLLGMPSTERGEAALLAALLAAAADPKFEAPAAGAGASTGAGAGAGADKQASDKSKGAAAGGDWGREGRRATRRATIPEPPDLAACYQLRYQPRGSIMLLWWHLS